MDIGELARLLDLLPGGFVSRHSTKTNVELDAALEENALLRYQGDGVAEMYASLFGHVDTVDYYGSSLWGIQSLDQ